ncbi:MAG: HlyD family secretion protein [Gelidibacter sp.]
MTHKTKKGIYNIIAIAVVTAGIVFVATKFIHFGNVEFTDNAQVKQLIVPVNSRVQGYIKEIRFEEHQRVNKGDTLLIIENTEFLHKVALAEADLQNALAGKNVVASSVQTAANSILISEAALAEVKALLDNAATDEMRYKNLLAKESVTRQEYDGVNTKYLALKAKYETLSRQKQSTVLVTQEQSSRLTQNDAGINLAKSALDLAKLHFSYTVITAPTDGYTGRKNLQEGQLIQPGQPVVDLVDNNEKWIKANYKETQTHHIAEGQEVSLKIDALPNQTIKGVVKSIARATGSSFSVIQQDNSAGNFVKIEQRIPVRIEFSKDIDASLLEKIRAGMNVESTINY